MAAMNGGLPYEFLNYKSVPQNNNAGTNGPTPPSFQANNNFTRYPPNIEIINLDDDVPEIENLNNGFPPFSVPAQTSAIQTQQTYSYQNGLSLSNNQNATHTGALTELLTSHPNYRIAPPQTFSYQGENRYNNYVNPPHTGQMECRTSLGFSSSDFFMPAQQGCSSSSSRPVQLNMDYSNERINGPILDIPNNMVNDNSHHIHTGTNGTAQTQPGLFPLGTPPQIGFSEQQPEQQVVPTEEVGTNQITLDSQGIDLNTTPQPKQRRRKYVPKVFKEGQKTRTPKTATPKPTTPKPAIEDRPKRKYVRKKGIEMPPIETPPPSGGTSDKLLDVPNSHTPNVADESIRTPSSCTPNGKNGFDNGTSGVKTPVQVSVGTSKTRKPVRRSLNFDGEELISNGYNNGNGNTNVASQSDLNTVPAQSPGTTTGTPGSTVPASRISLDLNISSNRIQEEFDRAFPPASSTQNGLTANTKQVNNGSGMNFSGYPYPPMPQMQQPNNHLMNNNNNYFHPSERNIVPSGLLALAKRNEQLIRESLCKYGLDIGNKRDHNALLQLGGNSNWSQIIQTPKKMRITDGTNIIMNNNNNNNNFYQNGTTRPNSSSSNSTQLHNAVGPTGGVLPNSSSYNSTQLHNAAGPTGGVFSLADAQRMVELQKKQISHSQAQQFLNGTPNTSRSSTNCQVSTPDRQPHWFMSEPNPLKPAPPVVNNVNNLTTSQMNQTQHVVTYSEKTSLVNQIQSVVNYSEKTSLVNQYSNNALIIANSPQPSPPAKSPVQSPAPKPEAKKRGRPKAVKEVLVLDPLSTPPAKEKQRKPRGRKPSTSPIAMSSLTMSSSTMSAVDFQYILDLIVQKMKLLDINRIETAPVQGHAQQCYAMVPYGGVTGTGTGTMVVYDVDKKKKKQSRARVVLSPITNQVWNLLMGEAYEPLDESNEKTLEEERVVLRGRIASFISRMHLVQGDRRFSPWKGSVVDSVVGVFLTQNVSDHLSSSAFMGLVSKYGPKAQSVNPQHVNENSLSIRSFLNLQTPNIPKEIVIIEEDFTDLSSLLNSEEKDENNSSQGSNKENNNNIIINNNGKKLSESSPDSGPELVMNNSSEEQNSTVSSQNSVVSSQSSPENHIGSSFFYDMDPFIPMNTSYTQLLQLAESNRAVELFPDLNKVDTEIGASCFYSNNLESYSQIENNYSACPSGGINDYSHPQNGNNHYSTSSFVPDMFNASNTEISIPQWPRVNKTSPPQPITPMVKIRENIENTPTPQNLSNPSKTSSEAVHNASKDSSPKSALETVQNPSKTASETVQKTMDGTVISEGDSSNNNNINNNKNNKTPKKGKGVGSKGKKPDFDWDSLRRGVRPEGVKKERDHNFMDSLDYDALRRTSVRELSDAIRERGMNNMLAERIKDFLDRLVRDHGATDLEWLRDVDPDKAKDYLLSIRGLGLKSVECVRLLTLHHLAFPVDTNVGRICVRLGWVPLQPLPESLQLHLLEMYPILENIQKYLWPRLCNLDQRTLYELHYQMITFGKVFCTKSKPNCNACPMRAECKHFASAFASARLALPGPDDKSLLPSSSNPSSSTNNMTPPVNPSTSQAPPPQLGLPSSSTNNMTPPFNPSTYQAPPRQIGLPSSSTTNWTPPFKPSTSQAPPTQTGFPSSSTTNWAPPIPNLPRLSLPSPSQNQIQNQTQKPITNEPIIEEPDSPEPDKEKAIEDAFLEEDPEEIPTIKLDLEEFTENLKNYIKKNNLEIQEAEMSKALVAISPDQAFLPTPKLKNISRLRTEHQVYELPDNHALLAGYEPRERDDPCPYLLSIWTPGETAMSTEPPKSLCICQDVSELCDEEACRRCVGIKEARREVVRGTILIPCRTAMRGSFPLNGTYFQVNELFADHGSSRQPVDIPREWIWNLPRRTVYFGTSVTTIFKGLSTEDIQHCFWRGFVCVRGFDRVTRAPRPLYARLHFPASNKQNKNGSKTTKVED